MYPYLLFYLLLLNPDLRKEGPMLKVGSRYTVYLDLGDGVLLVIGYFTCALFVRLFMHLTVCSSFDL